MKDDKINNWEEDLRHIHSNYEQTYRLICRLLSSERERIIEKMRKYLLNEHIHFDKKDAWQFVDGRPYADSLDLEKFILTLLNQ